MADISALQGLAPIDQLDLDTYVVAAPRKPFELAPRGEYVLQVRENFPADAFRVSKNGALGAQIDPTIIGPTHEGTVLKYTTVYNAVYERDGQKVSGLGDFLKAVGVTGVFASQQDLADAVELTAGQPFRAYIDWEAGKKGAAVHVKGMKNFPQNEDGTYQPFINHPTEKNDAGEPKRVWANLVIREFLAS